MTLTVRFSMVPSSGVPEDGSEELLFSHSTRDVSSVSKHLIRLTYHVRHVPHTLFCQSSVLHCNYNYAISLNILV